MTSRFEIERRTEFEAMMLVVTTVVVIVVTLLLRGIRDEEEDKDPHSDVEYHRSFTHVFFFFPFCHSREISSLKP